MIDQNLPAPLVPADVDLRGMPFMPLDVVRLLDSDLFAVSTGDEFKAAVALWCKAWLQVPAASLPADDRVLAHLSGAGARWAKVRAGAMRGWVQCDDGRWYHPVIAEKAMQAWQGRLAQRDRTAKARAARLAQNAPAAPDRTVTTSVTEPATEPATVSVTDPVTASKGQGEGQLQGEEEKRVPSLRAGKPSSPRRPGTRLPEGWQPMPSEIEYARSQGLGEQQIARAIENFRDYWTVGKGRNTTHADWTRAWQGWVRTDASRNPGASNGTGFGRKPSGAETLFAAAAEVARDGADHG